MTVFNFDNGTSAQTNTNKEATPMTTQTLTAETLVNAILSSPELKASILTVVEHHLQAVKSLTPAPTKTVETVVEENVASQERPAVKEAPARQQYPSKDDTNGQNYSNLKERDVTVGLLRGTDHYASYPHAGVFSPNKPRIKKMVMAMACEIAAMYNRGMRTLYVPLFPGAELLVVDVMQLFEEHGRFTDLEVITMDNSVFSGIREKRRHEALVFDATRMNYLAANTKQIMYDRPAEMTNAIRLLRPGHFLMVSDKDINRHLMEFFKRQRELGAKCYYVNPKKFISMVEVDPDGDGPKGGGSPAPAAQQTVEQEPASVITVEASMFEGGDTSSPSQASAPEQKEVQQEEVQEEVQQEEVQQEEVQEEEVQETPAESPTTEEAPTETVKPAQVDFSGITVTSDMFSSGPIDAVITPSGSSTLFIPDVMGLKEVKKTVEVAKKQAPKEVIKDAKFFYDKMKEALHYKNCHLDTTVQRTKEELILHFGHDENGTMFKYYVDQVQEGATFHDYVLAKLLDVFAQEDVLTPRSVVEYCLSIARYQSAQVRHMSSHCRSLFMTDPFAMIEMALETYNVDRKKHRMTIDALQGSLEAVIEDLEYFDTCYEPEIDFYATSVDGTWAGN